MERLHFLIEHQALMQECLKNAKTHRDIAFYTQRLRQTKHRLREFGQRSDVVLVTILHFMENNQKTESNIYYNDITESDAVEYTQTVLEKGGFKNFTLSAMTINTGKIYPKK